MTGLSIFDQRSRDFEFRPGPIFANVVLVDEINRATPKTQSALLEAMAEHQVTVDGVTRELPTPFLLIATENPIEYEGTFPLPEAQLDRFFLRTALGYPGIDDELKILVEQRFSHPLADLRPVVTVDEINDVRVAAQHVYVDEVLHRWVVELVRATRENDSVVIGSSVRGSLALERAARAWALVDGRSVRHAGGHRAPLRPRARPPGRLHAGLRRAGARDGLGDGDRRVPRRPASRSRRVRARRRTPSSRATRRGSGRHGV